MGLQVDGRDVPVWTAILVRSGSVLSMPVPPEVGAAPGYVSRAVSTFRTYWAAVRRCCGLHWEDSGEITADGRQYVSAPSDRTGKALGWVLLPGRVATAVCRRRTSSDPAGSADRATDTQRTTGIPGCDVDSESCQRRHGMPAGEPAAGPGGQCGRHLGGHPRRGCRSDGFRLAHRHAGGPPDFGRICQAVRRRLGGTRVAGAASTR